MFKLFTLILFLTLTTFSYSQQIASAPTSASTSMKTSTEPVDTESNELDPDDITALIIIPYIFQTELKNSEEINVKALNNEQKEVDEFIRNNGNIPENAQLKFAKQVEGQFIYTYKKEESNPESSSVWQFTVAKKDDLEIAGEDDQDTDQKFVIVGRMKLETGQQTEDQKKNFEEQQKSMEESFQQMDALMNDIFQ